MNLENLRAFVLTADEGSMARAAPQLYLSVSALSRRIQDLERELGVKLFDRTSKGIKLTSLGQRLLDHAQSVLKAMDGLYLEAAGEVLQVPVRFGQSLGIDVALRNRALRELRDAGLSVDCAPGSNVHLIRQLSLGRIDIALLHQAPPSERIPSRLVRSQEVRLAFSSDLPQASIPNLSLRHFEDQPFVVSSAVMAGSPVFYAELRSIFAEFGLDNTLDVGQLSYARDVVSSGTGFSLFVGSPHLEAESINDYGLEVRSVEGLELTLDTYLAWSPQSDVVDLDIVDMVTRALGCEVYERPTLVRSVG